MRVTTACRPQLRTNETTQALDRFVVVPHRQQIQRTTGRRQATKRPPFPLSYRHRFMNVSKSIHPRNIRWTHLRQQRDMSFRTILYAATDVMQKHLSIINQAISLNNAINESNDEFDDARERESQESTLLERNWLPEEELEVQGPISRIFSNE